MNRNSDVDLNPQAGAFVGYDWTSERYLIWVSSIRQRQRCCGRSGLRWQPRFDVLDDIYAEINALRLNCTQIISARPITVRLVKILLTQGSQPERRKRGVATCLRRREVAHETEGRSHHVSSPSSSG